MTDLEKEEIRLVKLLIQNLEAQLMPNAKWQKLKEIEALLAGLQQPKGQATILA